MRRTRRLVVSFMTTIANYDYGFAYHLVTTTTTLPFHTPLSVPHTTSTHPVHIPHTTSSFSIHCHFDTHYCHTTPPFALLPTQPYTTLSTQPIHALPSQYNLFTYLPLITTYNQHILTHILIALFIYMYIYYTSCVD